MKPRPVADTGRGFLFGAGVTDTRQPRFPGVSGVFLPKGQEHGKPAFCGTCGISWPSCNMPYGYFR